LIDSSLDQWNEDMLEEHFIQMDKEAIIAIPLSTWRHEDVLSWHYESNGLFTVRSAYRLLVAIKKQRGDWIDHSASGSNIEGGKNPKQRYGILKSHQRLWFFYGGYSSHVAANRRCAAKHD
jgi:hypothetical protein